MVKRVTFYCIFWLDYSKIIIYIQNALPIIKPYFPMDILKEVVHTNIFYLCNKAQ
jgi:hypothetical protein